MMYFCTSSTYIRSVIAYAVSQTPEGPYTFVDTLIYSGFTSNDSYATSSTKNVNRKYTSTNIDELIAAKKVTYNNNWFKNSNFNNSLFPNAIDPTIYYDTNGKMYMCYGSWSGGIFSLEIDPATGQCIHPKTGTTADGRMVDSYFGTKISGGYGKTGEGPFIEYNADTGYYYLWVTYGGLAANGGYNMRVFRSKNALGPFVDAAGNQAVLNYNSNLDSVGLKVMGNYKFSSLSTAYMACGHNSVLKDDDGKWYLLYHARFNNGTEFHEVRVHSMYFNDEGWPVVPPYEYSGDLISEYGYKESDIVGNYELINHGNDTSATIHGYTSITLNSNGTISGASSGSWTQDEDSASATLVIDGKTYKGYFLAAQDETAKEKKVMSFTAVGSNNQTVWGVKTVQWNGTEREGKIDYTRSGSQLVYNKDSAQTTAGTVYIADTELLSGISYFITNKYSGKVIDLDGGKTDNGTNIQQWTKAGGSQQEWKIIDTGDGYCKIASMADEESVICGDGTDAQNGLNVCLSKYTGADNQQWKIIKNGSYYGIVSKSSKDTAGLDVFDWSTENGGNINQWEYWGGDCQLWSIDPVYPVVNDGTYTLKNINSSMWISTESSRNVIQGDKAKAWQITKHDDGTYCIKDEIGMALTVQNGTADDGNNIYTSEYTGINAQKFNIICNKDGSYSILTVTSGNKSSLDVYEMRKESGANICQWDFWRGSGQKFIIEPANVTKEIVGDVNKDGEFNISDYVMLKKYLLNVGTLSDWNAGDLYEDGKINSFDLIKMKKML